MYVFGHVGLTMLTARVIENYIGKKTIDYRIVVVGSLLPDLIDKPIGRIFFESKFESGRVFAHALAFIAALSAIGLYRWIRYRKIGWLVLAGCSSIHDVFDRMWMFPRILFWPFLGKTLGKAAKPGTATAVGAWVAPEVHHFLTDPYSYISEIIGFFLTVYFVGRVLRNHKLSMFLKTGKMD